MLIRYFTKEGEYANRTRDLIPRVGEEVRFRGIIYSVDKVVWIEDEEPEKVHILITEIKND